MPNLGSLAAFANQATVSPVYVQNGNTPWAQRFAQDLKDVVTRYAHRLPRNLQRHLGPSELGHHCDRQLVGKMAGVTFGNGGGNMMHDPWPSIVGTAIHAFLDEAFTWESQSGRDIGRWLSETRVTPDPGALQPHPGTADLYDNMFKTLADHKGVSLDTRIPTPTGWTTMHELRTGDEILGADGRPCQVTRTYPVQYRPCYRVKFKGGASVVTDDVQLWEVQRNKNGGAHSGSQETVLLSSAEMREQLRAASGQRHLRVRTVAVELPEADLLVDPYVLGCWLGDGEKSQGVIVSGDDELFDHIEEAGCTLGKQLRPDFRRHTVLGLRPKLRALDVLDNKHIPQQYMRASYSQRLALLQGLMDTDGTHSKTRNVSRFVNTDKALAYQVEELAASLGWKSYTCPQSATGYGITTTVYHVGFTPVKGNPFRLSRKAALVKAAPVGAGYRIVQSVEPVECVPTRCIDVDSDDHLYLVTEQFVPSHNCQSEAIRVRLRRDGPPFHYFVQMLLYALGYMHLGYPVERIALVSWPRTKSTMDDMYVWEHMITNDDLRLIIDVLEKTVVREQLAVLVAKGEMSFWDIPATPNTDDCQYCPYFNPAALGEGTKAGCPGTQLLNIQPPT